MRHAALTFTKFDFDADDWHLEIFASNGDFSGARDFYCDVGLLTKFADELTAFPKSRTDTVTFEIGSSDTAEFVRLHAYIFDSTGHAAIDVRIERRSGVPHRGSAHLHIQCEVSAINRLGDALKRWISEPDRPMMWEP